MAASVPGLTDRKGLVLVKAKRPAVVAAEHARGVGVQYAARHEIVDRRGWAEARVHADEGLRSVAPLGVGIRDGALQVDGGDPHEGAGELLVAEDAVVVE